MNERDESEICDTNPKRPIVCKRSVVVVVVVLVLHPRDYVVHACIPNITYNKVKKM